MAGNHKTGFVIVAYTVLFHSGPGLSLDEFPTSTSAALLACFDGLADCLNHIRLASMAYGCDFDVALLGCAIAHQAT